MNAINEKGTIIVTMSESEAANIAHRLDTSSYKTFDQYRKDNGLGNVSRHPVAGKFIEAVSTVGVSL